ncbi:hypothetical protein RHMOL_Rhmol10G0069100 [Rhododendron molle]|uniref:Uncharacterized protein n=1 Tax=Rhododendron molle TaxID=49168 RepID=A0ACC0LZX8_RHOML|nr:hypothetical protein RHMOL_Rhmol10G0069100 [Rhododendron molle]
MGIGMKSLFLSAVLVFFTVARACSNGECQLLDECTTDGDCETGLYCFSCPQGFTGFRCVRSAFTDQFKLVNDSLPFNEYAFLTTHNAYAIDGEPSHTGVPRLTLTNQEDNVTQQLNNGARALMLDTYDFEGDVWLCHSFGGECYDFTAFEPAIDTLREVEAFLSANPSEIVTIILEDYVQAPNGLTKVFTDADGDGGMEAGNCSNREESSQLDDKTKSLVLVNYFRSVPIKLSACVQNSEDLIDMLQTCYGASGNRWANFVAVDYYKRSEGGGTFQAVDTLNGELLCGCEDVHSCVDPHQAPAMPLPQRDGSMRNFTLPINSKSS